MSYQLKVSQEYQHISAELKKIRGAVNCGFDFQRAGQSAFQQNGSGSGTNENSSSAPTPIRQIEAGMLEELPRGFNAILPFLILVLLSLFIWGLLKYEAYRGNIRRRYHCDIVVTLVSDAGSHHCKMVDISRSGAGFILDSESALSDPILVSHKGWSEKAHLIWRRGNSVGVKFIHTMKFVPEDFTGQIKRKGIRERNAKKERKR